MADPEFHNGGGRSREGRTVKGGADGRGRGGRSREGTVPPPQKKNEFLPENGGFVSEMTYNVSMGDVKPYYTYT